MSDWTVADIKARMPEFTDVPDAEVMEAIGDAYALTAIDPQVTMYCVGHLLALRGERNAGISVSSTVVDSGAGPLSIRVKSQSKESRDAFFESTGYGRRVLALEGRSLAAVLRI